MEACVTSPDWLDTISIHFFQPVFFQLRKVKHLFFLVFFCDLLVHFLIFNPELVGCFVKIIRNDQRLNVVSTHFIYKTIGEKETRNFQPVMNYMQWLILYSNQSDDVWQLLRWKQKCWNSSTSNWTKYEKWIVSAQDQSNTIFKVS